MVFLTISPVFLRRRSVWISTTLLISVLIYSEKITAQTIPIGSCGMVYTYDASGNQISRKYVCNNGVVAITARSAESPRVMALEQGASQHIVEAKVIYPNPTSGILNIQLYEPLVKARVLVLDLGGRVVWKKEQLAGNELTLDLSVLPEGNYVLRIVDEVSKTYITQNIIKL